VKLPSALIALRAQASSGQPDGSVVDHIGLKVSEVGEMDPEKMAQGFASGMKR
jgi:hypothetical protein